MKKYLTIISLICLVAATYAQKKEEKKVRETFNKYKKALLEESGSDAADQVDLNTITYYKMILNKSLKADSVEVVNMDIIDKLTIFTVRHRVPKEELMGGMTAKDFFAYSVDNGMIGKSSVMNITIGDVFVEGDSAKGQMITAGQETPLFFGFRNEEGWKIDITSIFSATNEALQQMITSVDSTAEEWIFQALEMLTGKAPTNEIWNPIIKN
ncbi:MAG: hypothetical protein AAFY41_01475 [Bacteroidota bacterium]